MSGIPDYVKDRVWEDEYPEGFSPGVDIPDKDLVELTREGFEENKDKVLVLYQNDELTYEEVQKSAYSLSKGLQDVGVGKDDIVAIYMENSPDWYISYHGVLGAGAAATGISPLYESREVGYQLNDSGADTIILHEKYCSTLTDVVEGVTDEEFELGEESDIERIIIAGSGRKEPYIHENQERVYFLEDLITDHEPELPEVEISPKDMAVLQYTGGTTGRPKGCILTHENVVANTIQSVAWHKYVCDKVGADRLTALSVLPWYHIYGQTIEVNTGAMVGEKAIIQSGYDPEDSMRLIEEHDCGLFLGVPTMFLMIANHPKFDEYDLSSLNWVISGAAPLPQEVVKKFKEVHGVIISNGYGLSEASPVTHLTPPFQENRKDYGVLSIGIGYPNTLYGIIDLEKDEPEFLPPENTGELVVSGPQVMKEYWNRPEKTEEVFFELGGKRWLRTGDVAFIDEDGYTYPIEREGEIIKKEDELIYPREIEELYFSHSAVNDVAVIGIPSRSGKGESIKAFIVLDEEMEGEIEEQDLIEFGEENLESHKCPASVEFLDQIPKSDTGKYLKRKLVDQEFFGEDLGVTSF